MKLIHSTSRRILFVTAFAAISIASSSFAGQGHMQAALEALQTARTQLAEAAPDKAGWRVEALHHIDKAIAEVQNGISSRH